MASRLWRTITLRPRVVRKNSCVHGSPSASASSTMPEGFLRWWAPTPESGIASIGGTFSISKSWTHTARRPSHGASRCTDSRPATSIWRRKSRWRRLRGRHWRSQTEAANPLGAERSGRNHRGCRKHPFLAARPPSRAPTYRDYREDLPPHAAWTWKTGPNPISCCGRVNSIPTIVLFEMRYGIDGELEVIEFHCDEPWSSKQSSDCNSCSGQLLRQNGGGPGAGFRKRIHKKPGK